MYMLVAVHRVLLAAALAVATEDASASDCSGRPLDLAVLILSRPGREGRATSSQQATRAAWAHWKRPCAVRHWFLLGGASRTHAEHDVLHVRAPEGYGNITLKVLAGMRWLLQGGPNRVYAAAPPAPAASQSPGRVLP